MAGHRAKIQQGDQRQAEPNLRLDHFESSARVTRPARSGSRSTYRNTVSIVLVVMKDLGALVATVEDVIAITTDRSSCISWHQEIVGGQAEKARHEPQGREAGALCGEVTQNVPVTLLPVTLCI
jgi:hypothetical protein